MKYLSAPPSTAALPGWLGLTVGAAITIMLGIANLVLDVLGHTPDPVLQTSLGLSLGSTLVLLGASHTAAVKAQGVPYEVPSSVDPHSPTVSSPPGR